jgi:hypothetical protein
LFQKNSEEMFLRCTTTQKLDSLGKKYNLSLQANNFIYRGG